METVQLLEFCDFCLDRLQNGKGLQNMFVCNILKQWAIIKGLTTDEYRVMLDILIKHLKENITLTNRDDLKHVHYFQGWNSWFSTHKERIDFIKHFQKHLLTPIEIEQITEANF